MPSSADGSRGLMRAISDGGTPVFLVAAAALPLARDGKAARDHAIRAIDTLGTAFVASEALKSVVKERRPDGSERDSFPSGHATLAFAAATMESAYHPKEAPLWYGGAAIIGWSRVSLRKHHTYDVLVGAALGYGIGRLEISRPHGIVLAPWIGRDSRSAGMAFAGKF